MARILITSGPTRQYLDPVRFLSNASSGRMGRALAAAAVQAGHAVAVVSGPVAIEYPAAAAVTWVKTTDEMLAACQALFSDCDGLIGAAAPCDYRPVHVLDRKMTKTSQPVDLRLIETADIVATLGAAKRPGQWVVGFALDSQDQRFRAITKMEQKCCDLMIWNRPEVIESLETEVEVIARSGQSLARLAGDKDQVAAGIIRIIQQQLVTPARSGAV